MIILKQPNNWSCLLTAFAMIMELSVEMMVKIIGHDGSEITWPHLKSPNCRRGFHIQELIYVADIINYTVTPFEGNPMLASDDITKPILITGYEAKCENVMTMNQGVITGMIRNQRHAMAWYYGKVIDPSGISTSINDFQLETFYRLIKSKNG